MTNDTTRDLFNKLFEDANKNGIPDMFEQTSADGQQHFQVFSNETVNVNGKEYKHLDELPPELKEKLKDAFSMLQKNKWMKTVVGGALKIMPEMNFDVLPSTSDAGVKTEAPVATKATYDTGNMDQGKYFNLRLNRKWVFATILVVVIFLIWWLTKKQ